MSRCIDTPVSWWTLERYTIGEVSPEEQKKIEGHVDACSLCRERLHTIGDDHRSLPQLRVTAQTRPEQKPWLTLGDWRRSALAFGTAVVVLCLLALPMLKEDGSSHKQSGGVAERGGEPVLIVVRERNGHVVNNPNDYASGDRFRLELTLPGTAPRRVDTVVFQEEEVYFPSDDATVIAPGNHNILPGTFSATGDAPVTICVMIAPDIVDRAALMSEGAAALPSQAVCRTLRAKDRPKR